MSTGELFLYGVPGISILVSVTSSYRIEYIKQLNELTVAHDLIVRILVVFM